MTVVSEIIFAAYRDANNVNINSALSPAEEAQGLSRLQSLIASVYGNEAGENLNDWPIGNYGRDPHYQIADDALWLRHPEINSRLIATADEARTIYLPVAPSAGTRMALIDPFARLAAYPVTLDGNGRTIEGAATLTLNTNSLNRTWFYQIETGNWVRITDIESAGEMPFPTEFDDYFIISLAMRLNPTFGRSLSAESGVRLKQQQRQLYARYAQSAPLRANTDLSYMARQGYDQYEIGTSQRAWETGQFRGW